MSAKKLKPLAVARHCNLLYLSPNSKIRSFRIRDPQPPAATPSPLQPHPAFHRRPQTSAAHKPTPTPLPSKMSPSPPPSRRRARTPSPSTSPSRRATTSPPTTPPSTRPSSQSINATSEATGSGTKQYHEADLFVVDEDGSSEPYLNRFCFLSLLSSLI